MTIKKRSLSRRAVLSAAATAAGASAISPLFAGVIKENKQTKPSSLPSDINTQPNIIFIMADDLGYADLGCYGARDIKTPNLDALAKSGLRLSDGYSNSPVCSATRTALMTGLYQYRHRCGLEEPIGKENVGLPDNQETLPSLLRPMGYRTTLVGKWHLGNLPEYGPLKSGYDRFFGIHEGGAGYFTHDLKYGKITMGGLVEGEVPVERHGYMTNILADRAMNELDQAAADKTPLFLSLHFTAPHWPWEGPEDEALSKHVANSLHFDGGNLATYAKMVENMDENIGRLVEKIERLGQTENTIIVFTSDNGGERFSDTWPFVGSKTELLEGGIRVPIIAKWPARIAAGSESDQVMVSMDFVPTLLAAAGSDQASTHKFDGENLLDVLTGKQASYQRTLFWRYKAADQAAVRQGDWKYLSLDGREFLFDIKIDQHERANLRFKEPERFASMKTMFDEWNSTMLPYPETSYSHSISDLLPERYAPKGTLTPPK